MSNELERSIAKLFDLNENFAERLTRLEENVKNMNAYTVKEFDSLDKSLKVNTEAVQKLEIKMAYSAGGFAVAVIIAQIVLQILMR